MIRPAVLLVSLAAAVAPLSLSSESPRARVVLSFGLDCRPCVDLVGELPAIAARYERIRFGLWTAEHVEAVKAFVRSSPEAFRTAVRVGRIGLEVDTGRLLPYGLDPPGPESEEVDALVILGDRVVIARWSALDAVALEELARGELPALLDPETSPVPTVGLPSGPGRWRPRGASPYPQDVGRMVRSRVARLRAANGLAPPMPCPAPDCEAPSRRAGSPTVHVASRMPAVQIQGQGGRFL